MAAASTLTLYLTNGQKLSLYCGSAALVGSNPTVNFEGGAVATSDIDFIPKSDCAIQDQINLVATAGECEVYNVSLSRRSGKYVDMTASNFAVTVVNRPVPNIAFKGGQRYRFIQTIAQTAA